MTDPTPTRDEAVLPCPFCGSAGKMIECMPMWEPGGYPPNGRRIVCSADGCYGVGKPFYGDGMEANAIASWNRRASAPAPASVVVNPWDGCFDAAMQAVLCGGRANRRDWNRPSHIELRTVEGFTNAVVVMVMRDGSVGPYTPSGCDMVAHDWEMSNG